MRTFSAQTFIYGSNIHVHLEHSSCTSRALVVFVLVSNNGLRHGRLSDQTYSAMHTRMCKHACAHMHAAMVHRHPLTLVWQDTPVWPHNLVWRAMEVTGAGMHKQITTCNEFKSLQA